LKRHGHATSLVEAWVNDWTPEQAAIKTYQQNADVIGIQVFYNTVDWIKAFIRHIRAHRHSTLIIIGGPHVSVKGLQCVSDLGADVGIKGEGEEVFTEWLDNWDGGIPDKPILLTAPRLINVNEYPMPDWEMLHLPQYWRFMDSISVPTKGKRVGVIQRSRGCNYPCTFCAGHVTMGRVVRIRDTSNVMEEIEYLRSRHGIDEIWMQDDNTLKDKDASIEFLEALATLHMPVRFPVGIRTENIDHDVVHLLKRAGVYFTGVGIETGNPRMLRVCKKLIKLDKVRDAIGLLDSHGIGTSGYFILGMDTETREEAYDSLKYALSTKLSCAQFGIFNPLPGSEDENVVSLLSDAEYTKMQRNFTIRFYMQPRLIFRFIFNLRWSQVKSMLKHPWILGWFGIKDNNRRHVVTA